MAIHSISLCAGVAGIDLGLGLAIPEHRTVCYVEREAFVAAVLVARMEEGSLDPAPVWDDVATFNGRAWRGTVDLITAGFPCQPVSLAGKREGMADKRFIWDDIVRIIAEVEPRYVFLENVPGILTADGGAFLDYVLSSLVAIGFDCEWDVFSAEETGAPHKRQRWFCLAYAPHYLRRPQRHDGPEPPDGSGDCELADTRHGLVPLAGRGSQGRDGAGPAGTVLGDANGAGREEQRRAVAVRAELAPAECRGSDVGDAASGARLRQASGHGGHAALADQEPVADASCLPELEPFHEELSISARGKARREPVSGSDRVYPPARNDIAGWAAIEASLEPAVCRDADGLASGLDPSLFAYRNDRLRAVGNGVVPLTAAIAWLNLIDRIKG